MSRQRVAILARNSYHYVICMYGTVLAGAVAVPLNMGKNWDEIHYELDLGAGVRAAGRRVSQWEPALADDLRQSWSRWMPLPPLSLQRT